MVGSSLAALERAELAARERRLAAIAEAEQIVAAANERAHDIEAATPARVEGALARRRQEHLDEAAAAVAAIEADVAELERSTARTDASDAAFEAAVELVVGAVLGEREAAV